MELSTGAAFMAFEVEAPVLAIEVTLCCGIGNAFSFFASTYRLAVRATQLIGGAFVSEVV